MIDQKKPTAEDIMSRIKNYGRDCWANGSVTGNYRTMVEICQSEENNLLLTEISTAITDLVNNQK